MQLTPKEYSVLKTRVNNCKRNGLVIEPVSAGFKAEITFVSGAKLNCPIYATIDECLAFSEGVLYARV